MNISNKELKDFILQCLTEKKAENINCIPLKNGVAIADYMIFASGRSIKNIRATADYISLELKHKMHWSSSLEGANGADWILVDAGDVIVHLFHPESREKLKIEDLWNKK